MTSPTTLTNRFFMYRIKKFFPEIRICVSRRRQLQVFFPPCQSQQFEMYIRCSYLKARHELMPLLHHLLVDEEIELNFVGNIIHMDLT